ncbi:CRISPR/Cas system CSM-associated protein Csm3, group 7 of RAMP superfamily [Candidatus Methanophagaceae archaeon]|nr:CRISPR/Cas system CSM-associated protein Csm3, group 7 of RAMP superfamily [Methanophagales archaeon]
MLKRRFCEAVFKWELTCKGPLLIRDERYADCEKGSGEEGFPDCLFMSHLSKEELETVAKNCNNKPPKMPFYVPGTSIRGPFRALAERIIRSLLPADTPPHLTACNPFEQKDKKNLGCSKRLGEGENNRSKYATACSACKLFGCAGLASRICFTDADIRSYESVYRDMIGINRFTGGVFKGANMCYHVLENTMFITTVTVVNFELWQLGLLAYVFLDFEKGLVPIGYGKTKGFGQVKGEITEITLTYPAIPTHIEHMGSLMTGATERNYYDINICEAPSFDHFEAKKNDGLSLYQSVTVTDIGVFWSEIAPFFNKHIAKLQGRAEKLKHQSKEKVT